METLSVWCSCGCIYRPQKPSICVHRKELNLRQRRLLELLKDNDMSVIHHPDKVNVVADALCRITMGSMSYFEEDKKDKVKDVHRLAWFCVRSKDSQKGILVVHHNSQSSLVVEVKSKYDLGPPLMELKESVLCNFNVSFS